MEKSKQNIFQSLKRKKQIITKRKPVSSIFFQLDFDDHGAYISSVDEKLNDITVRHEYYSGPAREILKSIEHIKEKNSFLIDWETPTDRVYLAENEYLIWQLQQCANLVDTQANPVSFAEEAGKIVVSIKEDKGLLNSSIFLSHQGQELRDIKFLNENHVFAQGTIYSILPISENFKEIYLFESPLLPDNIEKYLSLLYSYFDNISLKYKEYKQEIGGKKQTQPALIIEKIDSNNSLYLRISSSVPGFDADFFEDYDISRIVTLNDLDKTIVISDILHEEIFSCFDEINKLLKKCKRSLKQSATYYAEDNLLIIEESLAREFIQRELTQLLTRFSIFGVEKLKSYKVRPVIPKLNLKLSHGIDFLEGEANLEIEGHYFSLFDALNQYNKHSYIPLSDGTNAIINKQYINKLTRIFKKQEEKVKISFFDLPLVEELIDEKIAEQSFKVSRAIFLGFNTLQKTKTTFPKLQATLRSYQKQGYKWLRYLHKHSLGGCLADDMGLGKTLQAIAILASVYPDQKKSSLIVMPRSLLFNWENEIKKFKPELSYYTYHGTNRDLKQAKKKNCILTTYAMVRNDIKELKEEKFYFIILDESQNIKNLNSQISKAVMLLNAHHRLSLSGTPIENNLGELYALFRFLNPSMFGSVEDFNRNYAIPIQKENDKDALYELRKKIYPFILRRLKKDVLKDLPEKVEQTLFVDMSAKQKIFYEQRRLFYYQTVTSQIAQHGIRKSQFFILQALSELRQIASIPESKSGNKIISPKREVLMENIFDVIANGHKVLVFANFLNALDCIAEDLEKSGIEYLLMTGASRDRKMLVEKFQHDEAYKVFLMTLKTGGIGLNLTAADYIFIFDPWWNKAAENQAMDRTHRIGQDKTVFSYKLITRETIEEKILALQKLKSDLFNSLILSDGASIKSLDEKDVEFVLGG
ncbi:MAG: DEAD/DEAH box helicase [bacterium]